MRNATLFAAERPFIKGDYNTAHPRFAREILLFAPENLIFGASHRVQRRLNEPERVLRRAFAAQHGFDGLAHQPPQGQPLLRRVNFGQPHRVVLPDAAFAERALRLRVLVPKAPLRAWPARCWLRRQRKRPSAQTSGSQSPSRTDTAW